MPPTRALPRPTVDLIGFGAQRDSEDRRPIYRALLRVAMSAYSRGWTKDEWRWALEDGLVHGGKRHNALWRQVIYRRSQRVSITVIHALLDKAWDQAVKNVTEDEQLQRDPSILAKEWREAIPFLKKTLGAKGNAIKPKLLTRTEVLVMGWVTDEVVRRDFHKVTCPGRGVAEGCGIDHKSAVSALKTLCQNGFLIQVDPGRSGVGAGRKAAIYRLPKSDYLLGLLSVPDEESACID